MAKRSTPTVVHQHAIEAWRHFRDHCGLEPNGRDTDLVDQVRHDLDPAAPTLDAALVGATTDSLVRAIFSAVAPFASMSRDILAFFARAGAKRGRTQWALIIDEVPFDLKDFAEFVSKTRTCWGHFDRPTLDAAHAFGLVQLLGGTQRSSVPVDVARWSRGFLEDGVYGAWPASLEPVGLPVELRETAEVARTVLDQVRALGWRHRRGPEWAVGALDPGSILDVPTLEIVENDHFLRNLIEGLSAATHLSPDLLANLGDRLARFLAELPRRLVAGEIEIDDLQRILSLPVWKRRHEVYAVWVATEIVAAMPARTQIHHADGEMSFAFKQTAVASIEGNANEIVLYAERKRPLAKPLGKGRKAHVQPDFGLWRKDASGERCALVVEVKHYAVPAARSFGEALVDYARAHPDAEVVLVNHGPTAHFVDRLDDLADPVGSRCHDIGALTPQNPSARGRLAAFVENGLSALDLRGLHLVIDISGSMESALRSSRFGAWLDGPENAGVERVVLADDKLRWEGPRDEALDHIASHTRWVGEDLGSVARQLIGEGRDLRFVTDAGGYRDLKSAVGLDIEEILPGSPAGLILLAVRSRAP